EPTVAAVSKAKFEGTADCISAASPFITPRMPLFKSSAALTASPALSSMPPARPLPSISPTQAISFEGELMPKQLQIPSPMPEIQPDTCAQLHQARLWIPCHSHCTMSLPILTICPIDEVKAFTI